MKDILKTSWYIILAGSFLLVAVYLNGTMVKKNALQGVLKLEIDNTGIIPFQIELNQ